jgi:predicted glycosyltransferase
LADEYSTPFFERVSGIDYIKLPSIKRINRHSAWESATLDLSIAQTLDIRLNLILQTFVEFQPHAVLVDLEAVGILGELKPLLDRTMRWSPAPKLYLGLRDIIDLPEITLQQWADLDAHDYLAHYDGVLIYGCDSVFDTASAYHLNSYTRKVFYCGYVTPPGDNALSPPSADSPILLAMGGSGRISFPMEMAFVEALPFFYDAIPLRPVVLTGPDMPPESRQALANRSYKNQPQIISSVQDATQLIRQAEMIVTLAGYNSLGEVLRFHKKALVIPIVESFLEQDMRAQQFAELGLVRTLAQENLTPQNLARELIQLYQAENIPNLANLPTFDGAQRAASIILGQG